MKILLLSVLAVAMIGLMTPSVFAEEIELSLDTKKDVYTIDSDLVFSVQVNKIIPDSKVTLNFFPKSYDPVEDLPSQFPYQISGYPKQENGKIDFVINSYSGDWSLGFPGLQELAFEGMRNIMNPDETHNSPLSTDYVVQAVYGDSNDPFAMDTVEFELQYRISDDSNYIQENYLELSKTEIGSDWVMIDYEHRPTADIGSILYDWKFSGKDRKQCTVFDLPPSHLHSSFVIDTCDAVTGLGYYKDDLTIIMTVVYFADGDNPYFGKPSNFQKFPGIKLVDGAEEYSREYNCDEASDYFVTYDLESNPYVSALVDVCNTYEEFSNFECSEIVKGSGSGVKFVCEDESLQIFVTSWRHQGYVITPETEYVKYLGLFMTKIIEKIESNPSAENTTTQDTTENLQKIPEWVKNIFAWYSQDQISEDEVLNAIKFLVNQGIIDLNE